MAIRGMKMKAIYDKKYTTLDLPSPWREVFGDPEDTGSWSIYGHEKNGKTWFALMLLSMLSLLRPKKKVLYVSAEEGLGKTFQENCKRAGLDVNQTNIIVIDKPADLEELFEYLRKRQSPWCIIFDNTTAMPELTPKVYRQMRDEFGSSKLMIFISHYDKKEVVGATAKLIKKLAQVICHAEGLRTHVFGRCPGGFLDIHETQSKIYHGEPVDESV